MVVVLPFVVVVVVFGLTFVVVVVFVLDLSKFCQSDLCRFGFRFGFRFCCFLGGSIFWCLRRLLYYGYWCHRVSDNL